jgi:hypothetical protein
MARLRGTGDKLNRAQSIISGIGKDPNEDKPALPPVDGIPLVEETPPIVEDTPPVVEENIIPPVVEDTPPIVDENIPPVEAPPVVDEPIEPPVLADVSDDIILSKLSETLGRKIESYNDLKPKEIAVDPDV